jgi:hypothetical protein
MFHSILIRYVSGYSLGFEDFSKGEGILEPLCSDEPETSTMFRVVVKSNLTMHLAVDLVSRIKEVIQHLEITKGCYQYRSFKAVARAVIAKNILSQGHAAC